MSKWFKYRVVAEAPWGLAVLTRVVKKRRIEGGKSKDEWVSHWTEDDWGEGLVFDTRRAAEKVAAKVRLLHFPITVHELDRLR